MPLEIRVEREAIPFDLTLHMQAARIFERLLSARGLVTRLQAYVATFPLDYASVDGQDTNEARALFAAGRLHLFNARELIAAVRDGSHAARIAGFPNIMPAETQQLIEAARELVAWFERAYAQPAAEVGAWRPDRLDYQFAVTAADGTRLVSDHGGGNLDWDAFSVASGGQTSAGQAATLSFVPTAIRFSSMPVRRHWEMEDGRTDFGRLDINPNDVARLIFAEFMLLFSNDWALIPLELPVGTLTRIQGLLVTDVFGDQTLIEAADRGGEGGWQRWSMFRLSSDASGMGLLLAPTLTATLSSAPIEDVQFLRDEMANMVWAVEHRLASKPGEPFDPEVRPVAPQSPAPTAPGARYRLGDTVPANWVPFIPAHVPGSDRAIRLQRARLPGQSAGHLGEVLKGPAPFFVAEEEVPRAGRIIRRRFKRSRWVNGATFLWIGRESLIGRGEGSSGLAFDQIEE
jgi:hypothetical protein